MKKDDIIYCYKENNPFNHLNIFNLKNKYYKILNISGMGIATVTAENGVIEYYIDSLNYPIFYSMPELNCYFITLKQLRKEKLNKLNQIR